MEIIIGIAMESRSLFYGMTPILFSFNTVLSIRIPQIPVIFTI
jgi:hypothetical protein